MKRVKIAVQETFPDAIAEILRDAELYDSSCSKQARVFFADRDGGFFLKKAEGGTLATEAALTAFFHSLGLSAEVLAYITEGGSDYMLTRRIAGEDCVHPLYLAEPERLCDKIAELLRALHETDGAACPAQDRTQSYRAAVEEGIARGKFERELFAGMWDFSSFEEAADAAREGLDALQTDVLLHGDYCLPNIILDDWRFSGYIDLGSGGLGDRHIDLLWGIWTLNFNLGTTRLTERFLDAYGRDAVDEDKLRAVAAMEVVGYTDESIGFERMSQAKERYASFDGRIFEGS